MMGPMNIEAQAIFDAIVKKNPGELTDDEIKFLHARRPYMTDEHWRVFGDIVNKYDATLQPKIVVDEIPLYVSKKDRDAKNKQDKK